MSVILLSIVAALFATVVFLRSASADHNTLDNLITFVVTILSMLVAVLAYHISVKTYISIDAVNAIIRIVIGIWIIYNGLVRMSLSLKLKEINSQMWIYTIILAIAIILLGLFISLNSGAIISLVGGMMIAYAILDIIESMIFIKKLRQF